MDLNANSNVAGSSKNTTSTVSLVAPASRIVKRRREKDLSKPMFKKPFDYGWTRHIVQRMNTGMKRQFDVYYYTPTNVKCRSSIDVQRFLNLKNIGYLTKKNFSFYPKPIGIDNPSQEVIRSAIRISANKNTSIVGDKKNTKKNTAKSNTGKTKKKKSLKRKATVKKPTLKPKNRKNTASTSVYKSGNVTEEESDDSTFRATKSNTNAVVPIDTSDKTLNFKMNDPLKVSKISALVASFEKKKFVVESTEHMSAFRLVLKYLNIKNLLSVSQVCKTWNKIAMENVMCNGVHLSDCLVNDWEKCFNFLVEKRSAKLNTMNMLMPKDINSLEDFWLKFTDVIKRSVNIKIIKVFKCPVNIVVDILESCPMLMIFEARSIESPRFLKNIDMIQPLTICKLNRMKSLEVIKFKGINKKMLINFPSFSQFEFLRSFVLTDVKVFSSKIIDSLKTLPVELLQLEIGDCDHLPDTFNEILKRLVNLTSLRLINCVGEHWKSNSNNIFTEIKHLKSLTMLELINIEISDGYKDNLGDCVQLRALLVILVQETYPKMYNYHVIECFNKLSRTLSYLAWGFVSKALYKTESVVYCYTLRYPHVSETAQGEMESQRLPIQMLHRIPETQFTNMYLCAVSTKEDVSKALKEYAKEQATQGYIHHYLKHFSNQRYK